LTKNEIKDAEQWTKNSFKFNEEHANTMNLLINALKHIRKLEKVDEALRKELTNARSLRMQRSRITEKV
jgi:hypothetical protein